MSQSVNAETYAKGAVPEPRYPGFAQWLATELGKIQRGMARSSSRTVTAATIVLDTDNVILADATAAPFTVTLPTATTMLETQVTIKRVNAGGNAVTIGGTVDATVNPTLGAQWASITVIAIGTNQSAAWYKVASI